MDDNYVKKSHYCVKYCTHKMHPAVLNVASLNLQGLIDWGFPELNCTMQKNTFAQTKHESKYFVMSVLHFYDSFQRSKQG